MTKDTGDSHWWDILANNRDWAGDASGAAEELAEIARAHCEASYAGLGSRARDWVASQLFVTIYGAAWAPSLDLNGRMAFLGDELGTSLPRLVAETEKRVSEVLDCGEWNDHELEEHVWFLFELVRLQSRLLRQVAALRDADVDDVCQEAFSRLIGNRKAGKTLSAAKKGLARFVHGVCLKVAQEMLRRQQPDQPRERESIDGLELLIHEDQLEEARYATRRALRAWMRRWKETNSVPSLVQTLRDYGDHGIAELVRKSRSSVGVSVARRALRELHNDIAPALTRVGIEIPTYQHWNEGHENPAKMGRGTRLKRLRRLLSEMLAPQEWTFRDDRPRAKDSVGASVRHVGYDGVIASDVQDMTRRGAHIVLTGSGVTKWPKGTRVLVAFTTDSGARHNRTAIVASMGENDGRVHVHLKFIKSLPDRFVADHTE